MINEGQDQKWGHKKANGLRKHEKYDDIYKLGK